MAQGQWLDQWLENMTGTMRPDTMKRYKGTAAGSIKPSLGEKIISQVTGKDYPDRMNFPTSLET